ncbi:MULTISPECIES: heme ABC transporter ATP-binding protein [unclassified Marinobacterium]|uniref:heme ABC transporter ATP-binding protein n=1 Tax=unclassified Marinobacterium TaxID=2644139 RepID=UPI0015695F4D|nr:MULTISPECIES: heme ABC transporter ATP-binding protein [unclassified Marinobacterium]NRP09078.1 Hemin import ATP-binding protein HmuV [Marinobacterium sp. xm-g-48]NRP15068.1 Hemin import ATP-binding protein HmuV [Marinobacterium sp. xm-a-152]NRP27955.1 Hemin import ATP-binding protein HmuV [Marinobacterium sp. xm-d-420]NRP82391.1 Hemin import ATP-binding protein HmuV [Marinobacterium sp. xm-d-509]
MIITKDLSVGFHQTEVLSKVDFRAEPGQLVSIAGPNGSGKTTLLRALSGEIDYRGEIHFDGENLADLSHQTLAKRRAILPQATQLAFPFTVLEVVQMADLDRRSERPFQALQRVGLEGFESRFYQELSGGEKQRVQLARILVQVWQPVIDGKANWLLLDEPVSSLDIGHQIEVMQIAREYANAGGGVICVMHDLNLAAMFSDSIALFEKGRLLIQDTPNTVLTDETLSRAYQWPVRVNRTPKEPIPFVLPQTAKSD